MASDFQSRAEAVGTKLQLQLLDSNMGEPYSLHATCTGSRVGLQQRGLVILMDSISAWSWRAKGIAAVAEAAGSIHSTCCISLLLSAAFGCRESP